MDTYHRRLTGFRCTQKHLKRKGKQNVNNDALRFFYIRLDYVELDEYLHK